MPESRRIIYPWRRWCDVTALVISRARWRAATHGLDLELPRYA